MISSAPILFVSGAGLAPGVWDDVRSALPTTTTVAPRPATGARASLRDYAEAAIAAAPPGDLVVVAHSVGGVVGAEVLRLAPDRVTALLGVSAVIPTPGGSFVSAMPLPARWILPLALRLGGTRPPDAAIRRGIADGLGDEAARGVIADYTPESRGLFVDRTAGHHWNGRTGYVATSRDRELPPARQHRFADRLGAAWRDELPAGHLPMLECPSLLAESIRRFIHA